MKPSLTRRAYDYIFGYDYFLSHRQADGHTYAENLADALKGQYHCFLDTREFRKGLSWKLQGLRALKKSAVLILISTPEVYTRLPTQDDPVWDEVDGFLERNPDASVVVIDLADSFKQTPATHRIKARIGADRLRITETASLNSGVPSLEVLEQLRADFNLATQATRRERILRVVLAVILALCVIAALLYVNVRRKEKERIESQAVMLLDRAMEQIRSGKTNEAASSLVAAVRLAPNLVAPSARLQSLSLEYSGFERFPDVSTAGNPSVVWDTVWDRERAKPGFVFGDETGLRVTYGAVSDIAGRWLQPGPNAKPTHVRLSPSNDRLLVWVNNAAASYRLDAGQHRYVFEADLPNGAADAVFLRDGTLIIGMGTRFVQYEVATNAQVPQWRATTKGWEIASQLRDLEKDDHLADSLSNSHLESLKLSPSSKLLYIVWICSITTAERQHNLVFCLDLESGRLLGKTVGTVPADRLVSLDASSPKDKYDMSSEKVSLAWDDPHRGSNLADHLGGTVEICELRQGEFRITNRLGSSEGVNSVAFLDQSLILVGTDASRVRVVQDDKYSSNYCFSAVTKGAVQTVICRDSIEFWLLKRIDPLSVSPLHAELICEHWKAVPARIAIPHLFTGPLPDEELKEPFRFRMLGCCNILTEIGKRFFGLASGRPSNLRTIRATRKNPATSADGRYVAVGNNRDPVIGAEGYAQVWEITPYRKVSPPMLHDGPVVFVRFSSDGQLLVTLSANNSPNHNGITNLQIWSVKGGYPLTGSWSLADIFKSEYPDIGKSQNLPFKIQELMFSPDARSLFISVIPEGETPLPPIVYEITIAPPVNELKFGDVVKNLLTKGGLEIKENGVMDFYDNAIVPGPSASN